MKPRVEPAAMAGPEVRLGSEVSVTLAIALYELATNASKYGALSVPDGRVAVSWRTETAPNEDQQRLVVEWEEQGGPVVAPPARRGFGSELIERGLARQLGGTAALEFRKEGLRCRIVAPTLLDRLRMPERVTGDRAHVVHP